MSHPAPKAQVGRGASKTHKSFNLLSNWAGQPTWHAACIFEINDADARLDIDVQRWASQAKLPTGSVPGHRPWTIPLAAFLFHGAGALK
ncbi:MAG: hypothetical protein ACOH2M_22190 [Cypionkella sp.]